MTWILNVLLKKNSLQWIINCSRLYHNNNTSPQTTFLSPKQIIFLVKVGIYNEYK